MTSVDNGLRILQLTAENLKRIKAVDITPEGDVVVISGRNGQGKTSVLDAIEFALAGTAAQKTTPRPIRDGEDTARVVLDLGDLIVKREWRGDRQALTVTARDGAKYSSPQRMLDDLIGRLSFDPLAFSQLSEKDQRAQLLSLIETPFDLAQLDQERQAVYDERTAVNRDAKRLAAQLDAMERAQPGLPAEPVEAAEVPLADAIAELREAQNAHQRYEIALRTHHDAAARVEELRRQLAEAEQVLAEWPKPDGTTLPDVAALQAKVEGLDTANRQARAEAAETNRKIAAAAEYRRQEQILVATKGTADDLTERLAAIEQTKANALAAARMPIAGLGFDEHGVTYKGVPFSQCSAAERLRVSLAMAMALNPRLRVIRITDGSLLDSDNMRLIEEMAGQHGFQVWVERVDESGSVGVVIEDGEVRLARQEVAP
ncbi:AAA family ATPase [Amycolatopsis sp. NPDC006125]|uniref:AAA family ATPase n=1 Tax=Amycolatopsis sp. NPDC006125 TaxID=3156730 RepID=UPI0033BA6AB9